MATEQQEQQDQSDNADGDQQEQQDQSNSADGDQQNVEKNDAGQLTEKPEVTDEHKEKAKEMRKAYEEDLETTTLPGSDGTVSGTAVSDWVDEKDKGNIETSAEEGKVEYRKSDEFKKLQEG
ncbi:MULTISPECIES: hypothetical protein [Mycolicibacterium]|uniref:Uncharacterized protein n=2 Tax=Mycolicibacterium TaxID=1866885 RepID=A0A9X2YN16_9MYCO|nr:MULTISPECIES: hypothetical protein [Mycolicibacterium]MCV7170953.1 hypothetical protein [[Mycobacterium] manitobense]MDO3639782.1 hypothetical protein [Mycolicibacterium arseniciresistens]